MFKTAATPLFALVFAASSALPALANHDDDDRRDRGNHRGGDHGYEEPYDDGPRHGKRRGKHRDHGPAYEKAHDPARAAFYYKLDRARYDADVLDHGFFEYLEYAGPRSREARAFRRALKWIDWYRAPYACDYVKTYYPVIYRDFIAYNTVTVFIGARGNRELAYAIRDYAAHAMPDHVEIVNHRRDADIVIRVNELNYDTGVFERGTEQVTNKYPKRLRKNPDPRVRLISAQYTKVFERAEARYDFRIRVNADGRTLFADRYAGRVKDDFVTGRDLRALSPYGWVETSYFPKKKVARRFGRDNPAYRDAKLEKLRAQTVDIMARTVARIDLPTLTELHGPRRHLAYLN